MATEKILIPDIGDFDSVDVIEILINIGDSINPDDPMLTVESDKASMDIQAPHSGVIKEIKVKVGDKVKQGSLVAVFEKTQISDESSKKESSTKKEFDDICYKFTNKKIFKKNSDGTLLYDNKRNLIKNNYDNKKKKKNCYNRLGYWKCRFS